MVLRDESKPKVSRITSIIETIMEPTLSAIKKELQTQANKKDAATAVWFFKTGKGDYGHGDRFLGVKVPVQRAIAKKYVSLSLADTLKLLRSPFHEHRLTALFILVLQFQRGDAVLQRKIYGEYVKHRRFINNWDLVDSSAPHIMGMHLLHGKRAILYRFARSKNLWEKRIAILATLAFIRQGDYSDTLKIAEILLHDSHDLIHKAVGWMLREVGNKDRATEETFLKKYSQKMPRTMLRYAVEKFPEELRKSYLG